MRLTYIAFVFLGLLWGSNFIYMKWATALISPAQIVLLTLASIALLSIGRQRAVLATAR